MGGVHVPSLLPVFFLPISNAGRVPSAAASRFERDFLSLRLARLNLDACHDKLLCSLCPRKKALLLHALTATAIIYLEKQSFHYFRVRSS
jgi:hypothetical protein